MKTFSCDFFFFCRVVCNSHIFILLFFVFFFKFKTVESMLIYSLGGGGKENLLFLCVCAEYEPNSPGSKFCIVSNGNKGIAILIPLQQEALSVLCLYFTIAATAGGLTTLL